MLQRSDYIVQIWTFGIALWLKNAVYQCNHQQDLQSTNATISKICSLPMQPSASSSIIASDILLFENCKHHGALSFHVCRTCFMMLLYQSAICLEATFFRLMRSLLLITYWSSCPSFLVVNVNNTFEMFHEVLQGEIQSSAPNSLFDCTLKSPHEAFSIGVMDEACIIQMPDYVINNCWELIVHNKRKNKWTLTYKQSGVFCSLFCT